MNTNSKCYQAKEPIFDIKILSNELHILSWVRE